ncbi:EamA family transporter [Aeromicrobium sp. JJY06]|uniref:EamA family transporter n=1 Tax=Aeromicrobium sp. JJY06 TaxID=3373478 RepID=UPI00376ED9AE
MAVSTQQAAMVRSAALLGSVIFVAWSTINAFNSVLAKVLLTAGMSSLDLVTVRTIGCATVFAVVLAFTARRLMPLPVTAWPSVAAYGVIGIALTSGAYFFAISRIPIGIALLLQYTAPLLVALWVRFVRGTRLPRQVWVGHALCLLGLSLTAQPSLTGELDVWGVLAALASGAGFAASFLLIEHGMATRHPFTQILWGYAFGGVAFAVVNPPHTMPWSALTGTSRLPEVFGSFAVPTLGVLIGLVLIGALTSALMVFGVRLVGSARAGILGVTEPVISIAVAWLVLAEVLSTIQLAGVALALGGIVIAEAAALPRRRRQPVGPPVSLGPPR